MVKSIYYGCRRHVLRGELSLPEPWSDVYILFVIPARWDVPTQAALLKIAFERLGVAGLYFGEAPVMAAYGCGSMNSLVLDVGWGGTEVSVVWDGQLVRGSTEYFEIGGKDVSKELGKPDGGSWEEASEEAVSRAINLFFPLDGGSNLATLLMQTILPTIEQERRSALLESIVVTGLGSQLPGFGERLTGALLRVLPVSQYAADHQNRRVGLKRVPEYYSEVWERATPVAAWFGGGITSKMVFPDSKAYYNREEYSQQGAMLLHTKPL